MLVPVPPLITETGQFIRLKACVTMMVASDEFLLNYIHHKISKIMQAQSHIYVGIDVSKDELVISYRDEKGWAKARVPNTLTDINNWINTFGIQDKHFILEATGPYSERLIHVLNAADALFSLVNPGQSRAMAKVLLKSNKNDDQDAQTLSILGQKLELKAYKMPSAEQKKRLQAFSALASLQKQERQLKNQLHAFSYHVLPNNVVVQALEQVLLSVQQAIHDLENELKPQQSQQETHQLIQYITSINSVGLKTAQAIIVLFDNFKHFKSAKSFAKFIGLSPSEFTSGSSVRGGDLSPKMAVAKYVHFCSIAPAVPYDTTPNVKHSSSDLFKRAKMEKLPSPLLCTNWPD